jgi:hypothetical protein
MQEHHGAADRPERTGGTADGDQGGPMSALAAMAWLFIGAAVGWGLTLIRTSAAMSRLRKEASRIQESMREQIRALEDRAIRARAEAARVAQEAAAWAAGCKQGREDVITIMPLLIAAYERTKNNGLTAEDTAESR